MATSRSLGSTSLTTRSPMETVPSVTSSRPATSRSAVVLPQPDEPEQDQELAVGDGQRQVVDRRGVTEALGDAVEADLCQRAPPRRPLPATVDRLAARYPGEGPAVQRHVARSAARRISWRGSSSPWTRRSPCRSGTARSAPGSRPGTHSLPHRARTAVRFTMPSTTLGPMETKSPVLGGVPLQDDVGHAVVVAVVEVGRRAGPAPASSRPPVRGPGCSVLGSTAPSVGSSGAGSAPPLPGAAGPGQGVRGRSGISRHPYG